MQKSIISTLAVLGITLLCTMPTMYGAIAQGSESNTKNGNDALHNNTTGINNSAYGFESMYSNTTGQDNAAVGFQSLYRSITGINNSALGSVALLNNIDGVRNTGVGAGAILNLTSGDANTAVGSGAMTNSGIVNFNTGVGRRALFRTQADQNTALGFFAGSNLRDGGTNNIYIGNVGPDPIGTENNTIRIGTQIATTATIGNPPTETYSMPMHTDTYIAGIFGSTTTGGMPVFVDATGKLGTLPSSKRFKDEIKPMDKASESVLSLQPVTFHYKPEIDKSSVPQFGLVAEEVAKVNPDLVSRDDHGKIYGVRYEAVNAMLLNEFIKEHRQVQDQQKQIEKLTAQLKEQASMLQKVSAQMELIKTAPRTVAATH